MQNPIRVLLIENQTLTRVGLKTILEANDDFKIVGEAANGVEGFELFKRLTPDITILSLRLPDACAIDVLGDYFSENKQAKIIVLADSAGDAEISKALKRGASSYICKDVSENELIKAIRFVQAGKKYIQPEVAAILSENLFQEELTPTETRILNRIVAGKANKEIAYDLDVSENTIKTHVKNIFDKLGVSDRTSAATLAIRRGLVRMDL
ncbi:MAG TPA: response regulator transcription factor [Pyrinomonadaceae bacterium]|jgi:DNA-binding NarL/FixJ family response regulator